MSDWLNALTRPIRTSVSFLNMVHFYIIETLFICKFKSKLSIHQVKEKNLFSEEKQLSKKESIDSQFKTERTKGRRRTADSKEGRGWRMEPVGRRRLEENELIV